VRQFVTDHQMGKFCCRTSLGTSLKSYLRQKQTAPLTPEDYRIQFYKTYRREAEVSDRAFVKKYNEDLNTTLIFVSHINHFDRPILTLRRQAGLLSAVTAPFIVDLSTQLRGDTTKATVNLLSLLLYQSNNTIFDGHTTPTLYLGPPTSNPTDKSAQLFFSVSLIISLLSAFLAMIRRPWLDNYMSVDTRSSDMEQCHIRQRRFNDLAASKFKGMMAATRYLLQVAVFMFAVGLCLQLEVYNRLAGVPVLLIVFAGVFLYVGYVASAARSACLTNDGRIGVSAFRRKLDLQCISWALRSSSDDVVRLSAVEFLVTMGRLDGFEPTLVKDCLEVFIGCIDVTHRNVAIAQGLGELAIASSMSFLRTLSHLSVADPYNLDIIRKRYTEVFPSHADFDGRPFYHTMSAIHSAFYRHSERQQVQWGDYKPSDHEHTIVADALANLARYKYKVPPKKVPRWTLRFALHSLSQDPLPPTSVIADCLMIVAIDLGIVVSGGGSTTSNERWVHSVRQMAVSLT
jgi:hypothetical protein